MHTHSLVAMGAALFCLIVERKAPDETGRIIAGVAAGIGFVGAATVIKRPGFIIGLGTAASIWLAAGLGCLAGLRELRLSVVLALVITILNTATLFMRSPFSRRASRQQPLENKARKP